jgi:hypothetical protein
LPTIYNAFKFTDDTTIVRSNGVTHKSAVDDTNKSTYIKTILLSNIATICNSEHTTLWYTY